MKIKAFDAVDMTVVGEKRELHFDVQSPFLIYLTKSIISIFVIYQNRC